MAITIDGVTYRNLPEQVEKNKTDIETLKANIEGIKKNAFTDVDTTEYPTLEDFLQSTGEEGIIYLYPDGTNFKQYIWEGDEWRFIGDTELDITNMMTTDTEQTATARKNVGLTADQRYKGYIKPITAGMEIGMLDDNGTNQYENPRIKISEYAFQVNTFQPINTTTDIGTESSKFRNLYLTENANFSNASTQNVWAITQNQYGNLEFVRNNTGVCSVSNSGIFPNSNNARDLGISTIKWRNLYLSGNLSDGTNSISVAEIMKTKLYKHTFTNVTPPQDVSQNTLFVIDNDPTQILLTTNINGIRLSNALKIGMPSGTNKIYAFGLQTGLFTITGYILGSTASTFDFTGATEEITEY